MHKRAKCLARAQSIEDRQSNSSNTEYFHVVFTLPERLPPSLTKIREWCTTILFHATSETLRTIAADPEHLGAEIGFFSVLHSWGQNLPFHPHLHCDVPGGGLSPHGDRWVSCRPSFFLPVRVLSRLFRRLFLELLEEAFDDHPLHFFTLTVTAVFAKRIAAGITQGHPPSVSSRQRRCPSSAFTPTARWQSQVTRSATGNSEEIFTDRAQEAGINFVYFNGMSGEHYYNEAFGAGAALFDYNNDGKLDIFIVQGDMLGPGKTLTEALFPPQMPLPLKGRLYRNDLVIHADGTRTLKFTDVTEQSGINAQGYGMSVATGDYNNDGCVDLYITYFDHSQMWREQLRRHLHGCNRNDGHQ